MTNENDKGGNGVRPKEGLCIAPCASPGVSRGKVLAWGEWYVVEKKALGSSGVGLAEVRIEPVQFFRLAWSESAFQAFFVGLCPSGAAHWALYHLVQSTLIPAQEEGFPIILPMRA